MHCPNCGQEISQGQKFCRSCGMSLEIVTEAVAKHFSTDVTEISNIEKDKTIARRMIKTMSAGGIALLIGIALLVIGKKFLHNDFVDLIAILILLASLLTMGYAIFSALWSGTSAPRQMINHGEMEQPKFGRDTSPAALPDPVPSVTEGTTKILEADRVRNLRPEESGETRG